MASHYYDDLSTITKLCQTFSILFRWKGSIYKILWRPVLVYFVTYITLGLIYKFQLTEENKLVFESIALCCAKYADSIPVVLFLGFFTATVMQRSWAVYAAIPGTGKIITLATYYLKRNNPEASKWLRTLTRYVLVSWILCMRCTCPPLRNKYPTLRSLEDAGLLLKHECELLSSRSGGEDDECEVRRFSLHVINWTILMLRDARDRGFFENANDSRPILECLTSFKKSCSVVFKYQITAIPLSFIQAVTLTVHIFGIVSLMGKQFVDFQTKLLVLDCYLPVLPAIQYLAYLSWLKLGEVAVNPFGDDDDDFDIVSLLENHFQVSSDLLNVFELNVGNPTTQSMEMTNLTIFKAVDPTESYLASPHLNGDDKRESFLPFADADGDEPTVNELSVMISYPNPSLVAVADHGMKRM